MTDDKLQRVRKPRVHISYDVETENGSVSKELPFVVGVMGDFSGNAPQHDVKSLDEKQFVTIDRDNINKVMSRIGPGLNLGVKNTLDKGDSELQVSLNFNQLEDFSPTNIVKQVPALQKLLTIRSHLRELLTKTDRSKPLQNLLQEALRDPNKLQQLANELADQSTGETYE